MVSKKYSVKNLNGNLHEFRKRLGDDKTGFFEKIEDIPYVSRDRALEIYRAGTTTLAVDYEFGENNKTKVSAEIVADTPVGISYTRKRLTDLLEGIELEEIKWKQQQKDWF